MSSLVSRPTDLPPAKCRYPLVFLHGLLGFSNRRIGPFRISYYRGVGACLQAAGNTVFFPSVHPTHTVSYRVIQLQDFLAAEPALRGPFNIIAHSMGGLDARALGQLPGMDQRIRSITTISTPHRGSCLADVIDRTPILGTMARRWAPGIQDLTERKMALFNQEVADRPGILYLSVTAQARIWRMCPLLWPCYALLRWRSGPNDGEVSTRSALWGRHIEEAPCDHLELIGMRPGLGLLLPFDHLGLYTRITHILVENGF